MERQTDHGYVAALNTAEYLGLNRAAVDRLGLSTAQILAVNYRLNQLQNEKIVDDLIAQIRKTGEEIIHEEGTVRSSTNGSE